MASFKHPEEREIVLGLECPLLFPVDSVRLEIHTLEALFARERDCIGHTKASYPVTDPVGVASPDQDGNPALDNLGEVRKKSARIFIWLTCFCVSVLWTYYLLYDQSNRQLGANTPSNAVWRRWHSEHRAFVGNFDRS